MLNLKLRIKPMRRDPKMTYIQLERLGLQAPLRKKSQIVKAKIDPPRGMVASILLATAYDIYDDERSSSQLGFEE